MGSVHWGLLQVTQALWTDTMSEGLGSVSTEQPRRRISLQVVNVRANIDDHPSRRKSMVELREPKTDRKISFVLPTNLEKMNKRYQYLAAVSAGFISFCEGNASALPSAVIPMVLNKGLVSSLDEASWFVTIYSLMAIVCSLLGGVLSDKLGRRRLSLLCLPVQLVGSIVMATATSMDILLLGRAISSVGVWFTAPLCSVLISETVHPSLRGTLGVFDPIFCATGMFSTYLLGYLSGDDFHTMIWILSPFQILAFILILSLKETPYWLVSKKKLEEARQSLQWYRGPIYDISEEFKEIVKRSEEKDKKTGGIFTKVYKSQPFHSGLKLLGVLYFLSKLTGPAALLVYMPNVFEESGLTMDVTLAPVIIGCVRLMSACIASLALRNGNRKHIFTSCALFLAVCTLLMACFANWRTYIISSHPLFGYLPLLLAMGMYAAHSFGINTVLSLLNGEVYPTDVRSLGSSVGVSISTIGNCLDGIFYPIQIRTMGFSGTFLLYSGVGVCMAVYGGMMIPDNRGLSLAQIEAKGEGGQNGGEMKTDVEAQIPVVIIIEEAE